MYRRPKFLEVLHEIREEMSREADYDMDTFAQIIRNEEDERQKEKGKRQKDEEGFKSRSLKDPRLRRAA